MERITADNMQIIQIKLEGPDPSRLLNDRELSQILDLKYSLGQLMILFLAIDNRKNPNSRHFGLSIDQLCLLYQTPRATYYHKCGQYNAFGINRSIHHTNGLSR